MEKYFPFPRTVDWPGFGSRVSLILDVHRTDLLGTESGHFIVAIAHQAADFSTKVISAAILDTTKL